MYILALNVGKCLLHTVNDEFINIYNIHTNEWKNNIRILCKTKLYNTRICYSVIEIRLVSLDVFYSEFGGDDMQMYKLPDFIVIN